MAANTFITEKMFNAVKILVKGGASNSEIAEYMGISESSVLKIKRADDWQDFLNRKKASIFMAKKAAEEKQKKEQKAESISKPEQTVNHEQIVKHEQTITIQATHFMMQELQKTNELLKLISNKLAVIVDDLYGTKGA